MEIPGRAPTQTRARASSDPGSYTALDRRGQSRASPAPMWRLGVQCEGSVRDPIRLAALALVNLAALGQAAWGWKPELPTALPRAHQSKRRLREEEQRE